MLTYHEPDQSSLLPLILFPEDLFLMLTSHPYPGLKTGIHHKRHFEQYFCTTEHNHVSKDLQVDWDLNSYQHSQLTKLTLNLISYNSLTSVSVLKQHKILGLVLQITSRTCFCGLTNSLQNILHT